jgi:hypothetical protein
LPASLAKILLGTGFSRVHSSILDPFGMENEDSIITERDFSGIPKRIRYRAANPSSGSWADHVDQTVRAMQALFPPTKP